MERLMSYDQLPLLKIINHEFNRGVSTSYGLIVFCSSTQRWYIVRRKHTVGLLKIFWANFYPSELPDIIYSLTSEHIKFLELAMVSEDEFIKSYFELSNITDVETVKANYEKICRNKKILDTAIYNKLSSGDHKELPWLWTKGQHDKGDSTFLDTAKREFLEESGLNSCPECTIHDEKIIVSFQCNNRKYTDIFWVCVFQEEFQLVKLESEDNEVSERCWLSTYEVLDCIIPEYIFTVSDALRIMEK